LSAGARREESWENRGVRSGRSKRFLIWGKRHVEKELQVREAARYPDDRALLKSSFGTVPRMKGTPDCGHGSSNEHQHPGHREERVRRG